VERRREREKEKGRGRERERDVFGGKEERERTDAPRDKFMNFMGIWRAVERERDYGTPILICVAWILFGGSAFHAVHSG